MFYPLQKGVVRAALAFEAGEELADRLGIDVAHQAADVLGLPLGGTVGSDFFIIADGLLQIFRQAGFFQGFVRQTG